MLPDAKRCWLICPYSVNTVVPSSEVISTAVAIAQEIIQNSPEAVQSTKKGLLLSQRHNFQEMVLTHVWSPESKRVYKGDNIKVSIYSALPD